MHSYTYYCEKWEKVPRLELRKYRVFILFKSITSQILYHDIRLAEYCINEVFAIVTT